MRQFRCVLLLPLCLTLLHGEESVASSAVITSVPLASGRTWDSAGAYFNILPIVMTGEEWTTTILLSNPGDIQTTFKGSFYKDGSPWQVAIETDQTCNPCVPSAVWNFVLAPKASFRFQVGQTENTEVGYLELYGLESASKSVTAQSMLRNHHPLRAQDFEIAYQVAPLLDSGPKLMAFDQANWGQVVTNLTNSSDSKISVEFTVQWSDGKTENVGQFDLQPRSVRIFNFAKIFQSTWQRYGLLKVDYRYAMGVTVTGLRINESGSFTPLVPFNF